MHWVSIGHFVFLFTSLWWSLGTSNGVFGQGGCGGVMMVLKLEKKTLNYTRTKMRTSSCVMWTSSDHNSKWTALRIAWVWCSSLISTIGMSLMSVRPGKIQMQNNGEPMFCISLFHLITISVQIKLFFPVNETVLRRLGNPARSKPNESTRRRRSSSCFARYSIVPMAGSLDEGLCSFLGF